MASWNLDNIGLGNGMLPDGTKPLPEPMLTNYQWGHVVLADEFEYLACFSGDVWHKMQMHILGMWLFQRIIEAFQNFWWLIKCISI